MLSCPFRSEEYSERATRYKAALDSRVLVTAIGRGQTADEQYSFFRARTRDISSTGIGLVMDQSDVEDFCSLGSEIVLRLNVHLPLASVQINARPVRYQLIPYSLPQAVLVGAKITSIFEDSREVFENFLVECDRVIGSCAGSDGSKDSLKK